MPKVQKVHVSGHYHHQTHAKTAATATATSITHYFQFSTDHSTLSFVHQVSQRRIFVDVGATFFTGRTPFLSPNQQCQSTQCTTITTVTIIISISIHLSTAKLSFLKAKLQRKVWHTTRTAQLRLTACL